MILIVCICVLGLCGCQSGNDDVVATNDEMVMPTENNTTSKQPNEKEDMTGIVAGNSNVKVVEYDEKIASGLKAPEEVGGAVFTVLTTNITKNTLAKNIDNAETLVGIMKEYSNVLNTDVFNISYD